MLENEPDNNPTHGATQAPPTAQPRRRRAASRPAGPPASAGAASGIVVSEPQQAELSPPQVPQQPDEAPDSTAAAATAKKTTKRAPAKRAARKSTAASNEAESAGSEPAAQSTSTDSDAVAEAPAAARARTPRKRAAKKTAATPTDADASADESAALAGSAAEQITTASMPTATVEPNDTEPPHTDPVFAALSEGSASVAPAADATVEPNDTEPPHTDPVFAALSERSADVTPAADATADPQPAGSAEAEAEAGQAEGVEAAGDEDDELAARTKQLWADPFSVPGITAARTEPGDAAEPLTDVETAAGPELSDVPMQPYSVQSDVAGDDEDGDDSAADSADGDSSPRRRRRRRGGRRHRRNGADDDTADDLADEDTAAGTDDDTSVAVADTGSAQLGVRGGDRDNADEADADSDTDEGDGQRRRRRRRRRRGEDPSGAADDPTEVVVRVREPRARKRASQEVTGIDGSTRMEAKRQRRREGREAGRRRAPILSEAEFLTRRESVLRKMIIRQHEDLSQIAVIEDGILVEHYVDRDSATSLIGNVYLGRVQNVLPSMEAAFIDIGRGRNAVLYAGELDWDSFGVDGHNRKVEKVLKSGQTVLVQVSKDPVGAKGARLTNHVSIPGRYIVYAPGGHLSGISRKLPENERRRLKDILADLVGESASVIVRTAAEGASEEELVRDVNRLKAQWEDIERKVKAGNAPQQLYGEPDLTVRIVRDLFTEDFSELIIQGNGASNDAYDAVDGYVSHVAPHLRDRMRRWDPAESGDIFAAHRLDEQIAKSLERKVFLPSGGSLIIERTEAMTVIDVNTGKFTGAGGNLEATVTSNNLEAAEEIVRQLRLRDIGGIIVIDFIDMVLPTNRELLLRRLVECLGRDRTRHQVAEVTSLGLVQMTRKKIGTGLLEAFTTECPHCHGRGVEIHDMPVETQKQADGGARDQRPRDFRRGVNASQGGGSIQSAGQNGVGQSSVGQSSADQGSADEDSTDQSSAALDTDQRSNGRKRGGRKPVAADIADTAAHEAGAETSGSERSSRSRRGRRSRGGSASDQPSPEAPSAVDQPPSEQPSDRQDHPEGVPLS
ncbi:MAG: Ribonuclease E [uncultured Propionibacteriaceae bacterium]|uniref:Ribonuclease E n=1 Tax=uncultured Propionibacteriaceae bacterium TaxID=257457 RepID=A0A6J4P856_9ACTN|nr:MAG: Ribonuclease E [uncultured Propionibacteriaceae bacterium]